MDPATGMIIAATIASAAQGGMGALNSAQQRRAASRRAKETKRETYANMLNDALQRSSEIEGQSMQSSSRLGRRQAQNMMDTATILREAFGI